MNNVLESFIKVNDDLVALLNPVNSFSAYYHRD